MTRAMTVPDVRSALQDGRLVAFFQPIYRTPDEVCCGIEILARIISPDKQILTPAHFISAIENTALALPVMTSLMRQTIQALKNIQNTLPDSFTVSFNICADLLNNPALQGVCGEFKKETPENVMLCLELTERLPFYYDEQERCNIARIRDEGVKVVLDDFGTGHSNILMLRYAIDGIKIPKVFIARDGEDNTADVIVSAMINLARAMNIEVTAEGIETLSQYHRLKSRGADLFQGYLFATPHPLHALGTLLRKKTILTCR